MSVVWSGVKWCGVGCAMRRVRSAVVSVNTLPRDKCYPRLCEWRSAWCARAGLPLYTLPSVCVQLHALPSLWRHRHQHTAYNTGSRLMEPGTRTLHVSKMLDTQSLSSVHAGFGGQ